MFSKATFLSFASSSLAHGALIVGIGGLHTPASVQVQPAPTSMELILSKGENTQGFGLPKEKKQKAVVKKKTPIKEEIKTIPSSKITAATISKKEIKTKQPQQQKNKPTQARAVPGHDIGPQQTGTNLKTHGPCIDQNFPPKYPRWARRQGFEGTTLLNVSISKEGKAQKVEVQTSSGHLILDNAAIKAVKKWKFYPAKKVGLSVPSQLLVPVVFQIKG